MKKRYFSVRRSFCLLIFCLLIFCLGVFLVKSIKSNARTEESLVGCIQILGENSFYGARDHVLMLTLIQENKIDELQWYLKNTTEPVILDLKRKKILNKKEKKLVNDWEKLDLMSSPSVHR